MRPVKGLAPVHLRKIVADLSEQNDAEARALGISRGDIIDHLTRLADNGYCETGFDDGVPVVAFGVNLDASGEFLDTWFVCTGRFFAAGMAGIRYSRQRLAFFREMGGLPLRSTSFSPLATAPKWFKALGFEAVGHQVDGAKVFLYR